VPAVVCPHCSVKLYVEDHHDGQVVNCPDCRGQFRFVSNPANSNPEPPFVEAAPPAPAGVELKYCVECGARIRRRAVVCPKCGVEQPGEYRPGPMRRNDPPPDSNRLAAGLCGVLLGALGIHKFILGYTTEGIIMLVVAIVGAPCYFIGTAVMSIIGLIEGIIYLSKSDEDFYETYIANRRGWF